MSRIVLYLLYLTICLELMFQLASTLMPRVDLVLSNRHGMPATLADPVAEIRLNPKFSEHNSLGFRNKETLSNPEIVILGDSMVYGIMAPRHLAWPQQLGRILEKSVYNMGVPATGPGHYFHNLNHAINLNPSHIITSIYLGNDLWGSYRVCNTIEIPNLNCPGRDPERTAIAEQTREIFDKESSTQTHLVEIPLKTSFSQGSETRSTNQRLIDGIRNHSKLWGLIRFTRTIAKGPPEQSLPAEIPPTQALIDYINDQVDSDPSLIYFRRDQKETLDQTLLHPRYRVLGLDSDRFTAIREGESILIDIVSQIDNNLRQAGIKHTVLLHPTKEYLYWPALSDNDRNLDYTRLANLERQLLIRLKNRFRERGVSYWDITSSMRDAIDENKAIFPHSAQSHPNPVGYGVIANFVAEKLSASYN